MTRAAPWLLLAVLLAGCDSPKRTQLTLEAVNSAAPRMGPAARCVCWLPLIDERPDKHVMGQMGRSTFGAEHVDSWVMQALQHGSPGSKLVEAYAPDSHTMGVRARLLRLYVQNVDLTKSAQVVIELEYLRAGTEPVRKLYRGRYTGINWWGTDEEIGRAFGRALQDCVKKITDDLVQQAPSFSA